MATKSNEKFNKIWVILYIFVMILPVLFLTFYSFMISLIGITSHDFWIIPFALLSGIGIVGLIAMPFLKCNFRLKSLIFFAVIGFFIGSFKYPPVHKAILVNECIDSGVCAEGVTTKIDGEIVKVNKENCLKYGKKWVEENKHCYVRNSEG